MSQGQKENTGLYNFPNLKKTKTKTKTGKREGGVGEEEENITIL